MSAHGDEKLETDPPITPFYIETITLKIQGKQKKIKDLGRLLQVLGSGLVPTCVFVGKKLEYLPEGFLFI